MDKKELRKAIRQKKKAMTMEEIEDRSQKLGQLLRASQAYQQARTVYFYLPYNQEVRTVPMILAALDDGKKVAVPKVYGEEMKFISIENLDGIAEGYMGIPEPVADGPVARDKNALILMPGLAFDREGHRIGYGGGFYDRFLAEEPDHPTVALCYEFQMLPHVETEAFDIPVDLVLFA